MKALLGCQLTYIGCSNLAWLYIGRRRRVKAVRNICSLCSARCYGGQGRLFSAHVNHTSDAVAVREIGVGSPMEVVVRPDDHWSVSWNAVDHIGHLTRCIVRTHNDEVCVLR